MRTRSHRSSLAHARLALYSALSALCLAVSTQTTAQEALPHATPKSVGMDAERLDALFELVRKWQRNNEIVGAELLVVKNRKTVLHRACGHRDIETKEPLKIDTIYNIRSMTKPLLGTAVQILIDRKKLDLADPIAKHLKSFANERSRAITVQQLLEHRSGLAWRPPEKPYAEYGDLATLVDYWGGVGPEEFAPGTSFHYSDPGSDTLAVLVGSITDMPFDHFIVKEVFEPLGMRDSFPLRDKTDERQKRVASNHILEKGVWRRYWKPGDGPLLPYVKGSGTTWYSTAPDYARFLAMWIDRGRVGERRLLLEATVERALRPVSKMNVGQTALIDAQFSYGQHMCVFDDPARAEKAFGHNGSDGTYAWAWPKRDLIVLYMTQSRKHRTGPKLEKALEILILDDRKIALKPQWRPLIGRYEMRRGSRTTRVSIRHCGGRLVIDIENAPLRRLSPGDDGDSWKYESRREPVELRFTKDGEKVTGLRFETRSGRKATAKRVGS